MDDNPYRSPRGMPERKLSWADWYLAFWQLRVVACMLALLLSSLWNLLQVAQVVPTTLDIGLALCICYASLTYCLLEAILVARFL